MLDLTRKKLPNTIEVRGNYYSVNTDFRIWLKFSIEKKKGRIDISYLFNSDDKPLIISYEDLENIFEFANPKSILPRSTGKSSADVVDFEIDSNLIYAAFKQQYGIDLMKEDMHWHIFLALFEGLTSDTRIVEIMTYRGYKGKDKEYKELKQMWALPIVITETDKQNIEEFNNYFEGKGE